MNFFHLHSLSELIQTTDHPSHDLKNLLTEKQVADFAASFQKTAIDILLEKLTQAKTEYPDIKSIVFAGGVSANKALRETAISWSESNGSASEETVLSPAAYAGYDRPSFQFVT